MEQSKGKVRADVAHEKLLAMGYNGSERTTRRAVAVARRAYAAGHRRIHRPWVPEPGLWFQYDFGDGPDVAGVASVLFCARLAWSRFRAVLAIRDKTLPTVIGAIDLTLRRFRRLSHLCAHRQREDRYRRARGPRRHTLPTWSSLPATTD